MAAADWIGKPVPPKTVVVERGPVANFAKAVKDNDAAYADPTAAAAAGFDAIPAPPTFTFAASHWGAFPELQSPDAGATHPMLAAIGELMRDQPGLILHGEQEFTYHRPVKVGDVLTAVCKVTDVRAKQSSGGSTMTFVVTETEWRDADDAPVVTEVMTLIHRA